MEQPQWNAFEVIFNEFMNRNFIQSSVKRNTEFDTIWYLAEQEGAKRALLDFKNALENEAKQV